MVDKHFLKMKARGLIKGRKSVLITVIGFIMLFQMVYTGTAYASPLVQRIAGQTQYDTAAEIAKAGWPTGASLVFLVFGENFPDAIVATPWAKAYNAPILLTETNHLTPVTKQALIDLKPTTVFVIGGEAVISNNVLNEISKMGISNSRTAGNDLYDTSALVAKHVENWGDIEIAVATGEDFSDALSIASLCAIKKMPILLVSKDGVNQSVKDYINDKKHTISKTYVIGSQNAISDEVKNIFPNTVRIEGTDKYDTNLAVLKYFDSQYNFSDVFVATGNNFADALAGSAYAAKQNAPVVLFNSDTYDDRISDYLISKASKVTNLNIIGGEAVVPSGLLQQYTKDLLDVSTNIFNESEIFSKYNSSIVSFLISDSLGHNIGTSLGFLVDNIGKLITNYHIIEGAHVIWVRQPSAFWYGGVKVMAYNESNDILILHSNAKSTTPVTLGDSDLVSTGDNIYAIGNDGSKNIISHGKVISTNRVINGKSLIQISAPITPGSSGGVLVNEKAEVIGITSTNLVDGKKIDYAVPINLIKPMLNLDIDEEIDDLLISNPIVPAQSANSAKTVEESLKNNYSSLVTPLGTLHFTYTVQEKEDDEFPYDYQIKTTWNSNEFSPFDFVQSKKISVQDKEKTKELLKELQQNVAQTAFSLLPRKKIQGGYYLGYFKYPSLQLNYDFITFLSWLNFNFDLEYANDYKNTEIANFQWFNLFDDYNFTGEPKRKRIGRHLM